MSNRGLGINKDLEPLAREVRRRGGTVTVTGSNHVRWTLPCGRVTHTGLTMNATTAKGKEREIRALLDPPPAKVHEVQPAGRKFHVIDTRTGQPITNAGGFPRTFGSEATARAEARRLDEEQA